MPMPWTYRHASAEWAAFLADVREVAGAATDNVAYTTIEGVFRAFRRRLTPRQAMDFAQILPAVPRALFVQDWDMAAPVPWAGQADYLAEVKALRAAHNFATDKAIEGVSVALHRAVGAERLGRCLARIGPEAEAFWHLDGYPPDRLAPRFP